MELKFYFVQNKRELFAARACTGKHMITLYLRFLLQNAGYGKYLRKQKENYQLPAPKLKVWWLAISLEA
jgi:hypothetical protein